MCYPVQWWLSIILKTRQMSLGYMDPQMFLLNVFGILILYLTFSPLYRPVPAALGSPFLRLKPPS